MFAGIVHLVGTSVGLLEEDRRVSDYGIPVNPIEFSAAASVQGMQHPSGEQKHLLS